MELLKPDFKALLWLAIGYFALPLVISTVMGAFNRGE